ncbi:MAG: hypothetical protein EZS28_033530, partial [Streblomastix strix]
MATKGKQRVRNEKIMP